MAWNVWVTDTVTGVKQQCLPVAAFNWARTLNAGAQGTTAVQLLDSDVQKLNVKALTALVKNTLVLEWRDMLTYGAQPFVVYAGIISGRRQDRDNGTLTIFHADMWWLLQRRLAVDKFAPNVELTEQSYAALSLGTIAKRLLTLGTTGPADMNISLRITRPADEAGPVTREYFGYHMNMLGDLLDDLMGEAGGPDIDFQPRWVNGELDWLMRVGTVESPKLAEGLWEWNLTAEQSGVFGLTVTEDANQMASASYAVGEGSGVDMLVRSNRLNDPPYPHLDRVSSYKTEDDDVALFRKANGELGAFKQATSQWAFSILADGSPSVVDLKLGGSAKVWSAGDLMIDDGFNVSRLIQYSGDLTNKVSLEFQPGSA